MYNFLLIVWYWSIQIHMVIASFLAENVPLIYLLMGAASCVFSHSLFKEWACHIFIITGNVQLMLQLKFTIGCTKHKWENFLLSILSQVAQPALVQCHYEILEYRLQLDVKYSKNHYKLILVHVFCYLNEISIPNK